MRLMLFLFLLFPMLCAADDTLKSPVKIFKIEKVKIIEECVINFEYASLLKYSQDSIIVELTVEKEILIETFSKYDAIEILTQCQQIFRPNTYNIYYNKDGESESYIIELVDENKGIKSFFYLFFHCDKLEFIEIFK